jgi:hypothetical protein
MNDTLTPRTDKIHSEKDKEFRDNLTQYRFMHAHANTMEKELTAVTEQREEVRETLESLTTTAFDLLVSFGRAREERDRLAEALDRITISGCGILCRQIANEALQSLTTKEL